MKTLLHLAETLSFGDSFRTICTVSELSNDTLPGLHVSLSDRV